MGFNRRHYREIKKFVEQQISHRPWCYNGSLEEWIKMWKRMINTMVSDQDYEAAKAIKDSIREFLNNHLDIKDQIPADALLKLKEEKNNG